MSSTSLPIKRALSTSPPPSTTSIPTTLIDPTTSIPSTTSKTDEVPLTKRVKLDDTTISTNTTISSTSILPSPSSIIASTSTSTSASTSTSTKAKPAQNPNKQNKNKQKKSIIKPGGLEETAHFDIITLIGLERFNELKELELTGAGNDGNKINWRKESDLEWGGGAEGKDIEVRIIGISAHGDGLALLTPAASTKPTRILAVPFTLPGELIKVHIHRHESEIYLSHGDLLEIIEPSAERLMSELELKERELQGVEVVSEELKVVRKKFGERVMCKYFGTCSGCQYQPLSYASQLILKQQVVEKAFLNFSTLPPSSIPSITPTLPSPKQYAYRTKLTPHFQSPPTGNGKKNDKKWKGKNFKGKGKEEEEVEEEVEGKEWELTIGFEEKGRKRILDIEECVIATQVINKALVGERLKIQNTIKSYKRGSTLLLRDSLPPRPKGTLKPFPPVTSTEEHICITDHHETVREQVGDIEFEQIAGSFFQNNSSILPDLMNYIREVVSGTSKPLSDQLSIEAEGEVEKVKEEKDKTYLIDAYCGSGLFSISLADQFDQIEGVEIDKQSVKWAKLNAEFNKGKGRGEVDFSAGNAEAIFDKIKFPPAQTTILIDPPRKGCDPLFLSQLLAFNPSTIIYVSCNVHTQARDIGYIINESLKKAGVVEAGEVGEGGKRKGFWIESLRAADLFANTHHAEGVAVLRREV